MEVPATGAADFSAAGSAAAGSSAVQSSSDAGVTVAMRARPGAAAAAPADATGQADPPAQPGRRFIGPPRPRWETILVALVMLTDLGAVAFCSAAGVLAGFDTGEAADSTTRFLPVLVTPFRLSLVAVLIAATSLAVVQAWEPRIFGHGLEEFSRLAKAFATTAVLLGLIGLASLRLEVWPWVCGAIPAAGLVAVGVRYVLRIVLIRCRRRGRCRYEVLAVGTDISIADLIARTRRNWRIGWSVTGACTPSGAASDGEPDIAGVPVVGNLDDLQRAVEQYRYSVVAVRHTAGWTPHQLHRCAADLESSGADLAIDPALLEGEAPLLRAEPISGLPMLRLTEPNFTGLPRLIKNVMDKVVAALLLVLLAPLLVTITLALTLRGGPVIDSEECFGRSGRPFRLIRFAADGRIGRFLHRWGLDEIPQLLNVLAGSMSLVGPRPPATAIVPRRPEDIVCWRLPVKPGLTGLGQVSEHRDMTWDESARLALRYVENWTMALDALILWRTVEAVARGDRAR